MGKSEWSLNLEPWPELDATTWELIHVEWKVDLEPWPEHVEWPEVNTDVWEIYYPEWINDTANRQH